MERAAIWARVSTGDQESQNQLKALKDFADRHDYDVVERYVSTASAWTGQHRSQLQKALTEAYAGRYKVLLVWSLDRLSREGIEEMLSTLRRFRECGVQVISLQEPWTGVGEVQELLTAILAWVAAFESKRRSERIRAGLVRKKSEGKHVGRQFGAKDKTKRRNAGYVERYKRERAEKAAA
jgi:putative DNA-invertase from lambdoid prophage Rac